VVSDARLTDAQLAAFWRRHFEVLDDLVYGFMLAGDARLAARDRCWPRRLRRWRSRGWYSLRWEFWHRLRVIAPSLMERDDERRRRRHQEREARRRADPAVSYGDLCSARHALSHARFYEDCALGEQEFRLSDPLDRFYIGRLETSLVRTRRELGGEWA
jgi:hypothetical protein